MQNVILQLANHGINDIWAAHDSFGVHPRDIEVLRSIVKETFIELHKQPLEYHIDRIIELNLPILDHELLPLENSEQTTSPNSDWINDILEAKIGIHINEPEKFRYCLKLMQGFSEPEHEHDWLTLLCHIFSKKSYDAESYVSRSGSKMVDSLRQDYGNR